MNDTVGSCSICGGAVALPRLWAGVILPVPTCSCCGAVAADSVLPVIPMVQRPGQQATWQIACTDRNPPSNSPYAVETSASVRKLCSYCGNPPGSEFCQQMHG